MKLRFSIPSLIAAGFMPTNSVNAAIAPRVDDGGANKQSLFDVFKAAHKYILAGHSSHSSHASHASHSSSAGGGIYFPSTPDFPSTPEPAPPIEVLPPPVLQPDPLLVLPGNSQKFKLIVIQVQNALHLFGYDVPVTGIVDDATRMALIRFQTDWSLKPTGTITPQVLDALGITAK